MISSTGAFLQRRQHTLSAAFISRLSVSTHSALLLDKIQNKHLIPKSGFINGEFVECANDFKRFDVISPSTGKVLTTLPRMTAKEVETSVQAAKTAFKDWKDTTAFERSKLLMKAANLMTHYTDDLAAILTLEAGKPFNEAKGEIGYAISFLEYYAEEAKRINGHIIPPNARNRRVLTIKQAIGPVALITPWNFPSAMITRKLAPALAAGCTAVIKPANETPLSALAICAILEEAGFPKGVVNCVTVAREEVEEVGRFMCHSKDLRALSFTGSTNVGKWLMREASTTVKKLSLELGGNAAFIVFDDCDMNVAVNALMNAKFRNAGQVCIASNRIFVHEKIYDEFAKLLAEKVQKQIRPGDGFEKNTTMGPLINANAVSKVSSHVEDCIAKGAKVVTGGKPHAALNAEGGFFFEPTILSNVSSNMLPFSQETFGPLVPLIKFSTEQEVIDMANDSDFGLASYFCTKDLARAWRVAEALEAGMVGVNEGAISFCSAPFGGVKESGLGREGGQVGIEEFLEEKYICMGLGNN